MKRRHILCGLLLLSITFLIIQSYLFLYLYPAITKKENIEAIVKTLQLANIDIFLTDPHILKKVVQPELRTKSSSCSFLCHDEPVTWFGIHGNSIALYKQSSVKQTLEENRFIVREIFQQQTWPQGGAGVVANDDSNVEALGTTLTHILINRERYTVCISVFFSRGQHVFSYLWHHKLPIADLNELPWQLLSSDLQMLHFPGAYDKFEMVKVSLDGVSVLAARYPGSYLHQVSAATFIECNGTRAKQFFRKYPKDKSQNAKEFQQQALEIVKKAKIILDQLAVPFWLSSGTCLGWYRQCDLITYSQDVDLGIRIDDYNPKIMPMFKRGGFLLDHIFGKISDSFQLAFKFNNVKVDLFFFYQEGDTMWNGGTDYETANKYKYIFPKFSLCWTDFLKMKVRIPCQTQSYIEANYGTKWLEPVKQWDWRESPSNVINNGQWSQSDWEEVIQLF